MVYVDVDFDVKEIKEENKMEINPLAAVEYLKDTVTVGISLYGNIWEIKEKGVDYKNNYEKYLKEGPLDKDKYNNISKFDFDKTKIYNNGDMGLF